jgi:hypothetical protein
MSKKFYRTCHNFYHISAAICWQVINLETLLFIHSLFVCIMFV